MRIKSPEEFLKGKRSPKTRSQAFKVMQAYSDYVLKQKGIIMQNIIVRETNTKDTIEDMRYLQR